MKVTGDDLAEFSEFLKRMDRFTGAVIDAFDKVDDRFNTLEDYVIEMKEEQKQTNAILKEGFATTNKLLEKMLERLDKVEVSISKLADMEARIERIEKVVFKAS